MTPPNSGSLPVKLKGVGDSLWVTLDPAQSEDFLKKELHKLFARLKHLAVNARVIIDCGKEGNDNDLIERLGQYLKETFDVGRVTGPPAERSISREQKRQKDISDSWMHHGSDVLMLSGRVRSGQKVSAQKHLVVLGDVNPGAEISAGGDSLVMGRLLGMAFAGQPENEDAIILALEFRPTQIQIGGYVAAGMNASASNRAEYAYVEGGVVTVEEYLKSNPFSRLQWPEVR
jgi:septum site-determining protein MinC